MTGFRFYSPTLIQGLSLHLQGETQRRCVLLLFLTVTERQAQKPKSKNKMLPSEALLDSHSFQGEWFKHVCAAKTNKTVQTDLRQVLRRVSLIRFSGGVCWVSIVLRQKSFTVAGSCPPPPVLPLTPSSSAFLTILSRTEASFMTASWIFFSGNIYI